MTKSSPETIIMKTTKNPHKRNFDCMNNSTNSSMHSPASAAMEIDPPPSFKPREYQMKMLEVALKRNTIAHLGTNTGKTMIAVMIIKEIAPSLKLNPGEKKLIIFLAPTRSLVEQQFKVIKDNTDLRVDYYHGAKGKAIGGQEVDEWDAEIWGHELNKTDVLVMTPQILVDILRKAFLNFETISLLILDECHHAGGNHPYASIMKDFYHKSREKPKVFGMTASPVIRKGISSVRDCEEQISELEGILDSQIYSIETTTELEEFITPAEPTYCFYDKVPASNSELKEKLESVQLKFDASLLDLQRSLPDNYTDINDKFDMLRKRLSNDHAKILYCIDDLGLICAYEAVKICIENLPTAIGESGFYRKSCLQCKYFLHEVLSIVEESLPCGHEKLLDARWDCQKILAGGFVSSKLCELFHIFDSFGEARQVMCLIFVERIITAKVIERIMKRVTYLSQFTISYLTGSTSSVDALAPKLQRETLQSFHDGKVNLLFATDVVEEGIHVPSCSSVIRFDLPKTVRSYVQSRGRARQNDSQFIIMLERGNMKQRDQMFEIIRSEYSMTDTAIKRDPGACVLKACNFKGKDAYRVDVTGASVTVDSSVSLIHKYCAKLPGDKFYTPKPRFRYLLEEELYKCEMTLPPNAAFQTIVGPPGRNSYSSKQLVCLDACKKLHLMGVLNDHLLPSNEEPSVDDHIVKRKELPSGAGTTKRKELHGTVCIGALAGTWGEKLGGTIFHCYKIDFTCSKVDERYSSYVLLLESKLDADVGDVEVDLYLVSKSVKASVSPCGQLHLDVEQIGKAKCFQELFFNGIFGKLFIGSKKSGGKREFLLQTNQSLWDPSNMYLLLPLESLDISSQEPWRINWTAIYSSVSAVDFVKDNAWLSVEQSDRTGGSSSLQINDSSTADPNSINTIHLANKGFPMNNLNQLVVLAIHTGKIYSILEVLQDTSAESPFDGNSDTKPSAYSSFADYFSKKYGIVLARPHQPLLLLKQSHRAHNLLVDFNGEGTSHGKKAKCDNKMNVDRQRFHVRMPPELLVSIDVRMDVMKSFYLLPSIMQRLESLMLASQLREEIARHSTGLHISSSLILEALTTLRCSESFSMERLELLGDSVLKYAVSCHLYLKYPKEHEGRLSNWRSRAVCNSNLHKLGIDRGIQGYVRDSAFDPCRWTAPGQNSLRLCPCEHGVDTLEVPLHSKFQTQDVKVVVGKCCDKGHRWIGSKTIADCVEALIGAYYVGGGLVAALQLMKWLKVSAELDLSLVDEAISRASLHSYVPKAKEVEMLQSKLGFDFSVKGLLLEAMTHPSEQEEGLDYCYQRLEFLGDSVLDILITQHLYQNHTYIDPGELTDLRSASVSNENFAKAAVRRNLHLYLQHKSGLLQSEITEYVKFVSGSCSSMSAQSIKCPKALGDLVESIAGAVLIDTKLSLDEVWRIFKPLLSPIVTPDKLELPPYRELNQLCDSLGYFMKDFCRTEGDTVHAELRLQLKDVLLVGEGFGPNLKAAKGQAAQFLLKDLEDRGISKRRTEDPYHTVECSSLDSGKKIFNKIQYEGTTKHNCNKRSKTTAESASDNCSVEVRNSNIPSLPSINMKKGGPRTSLYDICKSLQWPMPTFTTTEEKSRTPFDIGEGPERRKGCNSFVSRIKLIIPNFGVLEVSGEERADKKSSYDSAALLMLYELQRHGMLTIGKVLT